jgi:hypothetical protein
MLQGWCFTRVVLFREFSYSAQSLFLMYRVYYPTAGLNLGQEYLQLIPLQPNTNFLQTVSVLALKAQTAALDQSLHPVIGGVNVGGKCLKAAGSPVVGSIASIE